jgi:hypothetical protein
MSVQNLFFARPAPKKPSPPLFSITGCKKRRQNVLRAPFFIIFHTSDLLSLPKSEIRAGKLLADPGHPQEELVGGRPHHRYIKTRRCRPRVDRALQKNTHTAENHAKKLPEASISLPAHLFPNTPRMLRERGKLGQSRKPFKEPSAGILDHSMGARNAGSGGSQLPRR